MFSGITIKDSDSSCIGAFASQMTVHQDVLHKIQFSMCTHANNQNTKDSTEREMKMWLALTSSVSLTAKEIHKNHHICRNFLFV